MAQPTDEQGQARMFDRFPIGSIAEIVTAVCAVIITVRIL